MGKPKPCAEWPNCECPRCVSYQRSVDAFDAIASGLGAPGMCTQEAKDRDVPRVPFKYAPLTAVLATIPKRFNPQAAVQEATRGLAMPCGACDACFERCWDLCENKS